MASISCFRKIRPSAEKLNALLSFDSVDDYWGDVGIDFGCEIASLLSQEEWEILHSIWKKNLANGSVDLPIFLIVYKVVLSAIESLNGLDESFEKYISFVKPNALERLKDMKHIVSKEEFSIIENILTCIKSSI